MITESITIVSLIGSCALIAWFAKKHFQPQLEKEWANNKKELAYDLIEKKNKK